jgi:acyl-CoA thioesterase
MSDLRAFLSAGDRFAAGVGIELVEVREGFARARLAIAPGHLNAAGVVQGGVVFTLADLAFAAAANSHGTVALAVSANVTYVKAVRTGVLTAEAREEALSRRLSTCTVRVLDEGGELVAVFGGTAFRKDDPMPPRDAG